MIISLQPALSTSIKERRVIPYALCAMVLALCTSAHAQQQKKLSRIGYLSSVDPINESAGAEGIRRALNELGYVEGQTLPLNGVASAASYGVKTGRPARENA